MESNQGWNHQMSEQELIQRIQSGDTEAFRDFYEQNARLVYRYILVRMEDSHDAEDLTAETFIKAWQAFPNFKWRGKPALAWLYSIAHNLVMDKYRQKRDLLDWLPWRHGYEERPFERVENQDEIKSAFSTLSYEQQVILHLHFYENYNLIEVAEVLGKSPNAVRVAHSRALERLRRTMSHADT